MKRKIKYTNENLGKVEVVRDFLPHPDELVLKESNVKVTLNLSKSSVEFFKEIAKKNNSQYQKVIRNLLDQYASRFSD
ncbi:MAG: CopG family transcriptional regulator [Ignavibacteria bacterium]|nr:CopG family transcriptional regulator [Ignavibacteria bacterium]